MDKKIEEILANLKKSLREPLKTYEITDDVIEKTGGEGLYAKHELPLTIARSDIRVDVTGDNLTVEDCPSAVTVKLNHKKNPEIDLQKIDEIEGRFKCLFLNNSVGAGTLKILTGDRGLFKAKKKLNKFNDNEKLIFGTGDDYEIYFNSANFLINYTGSTLTTICLGDTSGDDGCIRANKVNAYPQITLYGGADIYYSCNNGFKHIFRESAVIFLSLYEDGTDDIIEGGTTNNDLYLKPDGSGVVKFGSYSGKGAEVFAGFITIKDSGGNSRKVMVCA